VTGTPAPADPDMARALVERIGRAQARAEHARQRRAESAEHAERAATDDERTMHADESQRHAAAVVRQQEAVLVQVEHLRHLFDTDDDLERWLAEHADDAAADPERADGPA